MQTQTIIQYISLAKIEKSDEASCNDANSIAVAMRWIMHRNGIQFEAWPHLTPRFVVYTPSESYYDIQSNPWIHILVEEEVKSKPCNR